MASVLVLSGNSAAFELFVLKLFERADGDTEVVDPQPYDATLTVTGGGSGLTRKLKTGSLLIASKSNPPSGTVGLISRARQDRKNLVGLRFQEGYYAGVVDITITDRPLDRISVTESLSSPVEIEIAISSGPIFHFGEIGIVGAESIDTAAIATEAGLVPGEVAGSQVVFATEAALVAALGRNGHPYPRISDRTITADHAGNVVNVRIDVQSGPVARFGRVEVMGARQIDPDFIAYVADIPTGDPYSSKVLDRSKKRLSEIEALGSVSLRPAATPDADGSVPIIIEISERKRKVIGAGASWSSTDGAKVNAYWKHRNVFGHGELFRIDVGVGRLAERFDYHGLDANFGLLLSQPGFFGPATRFDTSFTALQEHPDAYRRRAVIARAINYYQYSEELELSGGVAAEYSDIDDAVGSDQFGLISLPLAAVYDSRDDRLNPAEGIRARLGVEPTVDVLNNTNTPNQTRSK